MTAPAIETRALVRRFGEVEALGGLDLTVSAPGVFGFLGVNGAGKTTTFRVLTGLIRPTSGEAKVLGSAVGPGSEAVRRRVGYLPQEPAAYGWMTGEEFLLFVADLFGLGRAEARKRCAELLDLCGLEDASKRKVAGYSGGMKQRLGIAQALVNSPELLLLDEPVSSLDPVGRAEVLDLMAELGRESCVFMSSHILADIERVCEDVAIIDRGRIIACDKTATLRRRYVRPAFDVVLRGDADRFVRAASGVPFVESACRLADEGDAARVHVAVRDLAAGERGLPELVASLGLSLVSFSTSMPTLEEVFIRLIGRGDEGEGGA